MYNVKNKIEEISQKVDQADEVTENHFGSAHEFLNWKARWIPAHWGKQVSQRGLKTCQRTGDRDKHVKALRNWGKVTQEGTGKQMSKDISTAMLEENERWMLQTSEGKLLPT